MANWLWFTRAHCVVYRGTRGLVGGNLIGMHMLLLTTKGRKTGRARTLPLAYVEDHGEYIIVASNGGAEKPPAWWLNLQASKTAEVQVGSERFTVGWELAPVDQRIEYWRKLQAAIPAYRRYRTKTDRLIPIVRLKPVQEGWQTRPVSSISATTASTDTTRTQGATSAQGAPEH
jgi:deazaflavin-dependent oxidoreductase (nitroreductase family)